MDEDKRMGKHITITENKYTVGGNFMVRKNKAKDRMAHHGAAKITHSLKEVNSKENQNIKDYDRAWEDDRL